MGCAFSRAAARGAFGIMMMLCASATGKPIANATVRFKIKAVETYTDAQGSHALDALGSAVIRPSNNRGAPLYEYGLRY
jgi:hypothetical protein